MENDNHQPFTPAVRRILRDYHSGGISESDCLACSSACCSYGGFAILENVLRIYELYRQGCLKREDYEFPQGLSFGDFVEKYFDLTITTVGRWIWKTGMLLFYMRSLSAENQVISIPRVGYYYAVRLEMFRANPWLNKGCIFLNRKVPNWPEDDKDASRQCILHSKESQTHITAKPIDCVFYTCVKPIKAKVPTPKESRCWFRAVAEMCPANVDRYRTLVANERAAKETSDVGFATGHPCSAPRENE